MILLLTIFVGGGSYYGYQQYKFEKYVQKKWEESITPIKKQYQEALEYSRKAKEALKKEKQMLSQDHYGGKTPEETLAMFVEALKKKDAKLAARYYLPWEWEKQEREMEKWIKHDSVYKFLNAYKHGRIAQKEYVSYLAIEIYPEGENKYHYTINMVFNSETGIWKIEKF